MPAPYHYPYRPEGWSKDIYPMPAFQHLAVTDVERSSSWYQQVLGFANVFTARAADGALMVAHLRWCMFGDVLLVPARTPSSGPRGVGLTMYFSTEDVDAIVERAASHVAAPIDGPAERPWNTREVTFADPDGYRLTFAAPTQRMLAQVASGNIESMESVVERLRSTFKR